jgi:hypothetical protein
LLEPFLGVFVSGVPIRMTLKSKFAVRLLDIIITGIATDP